jgi:hypothetical protein
MVFLAMFDVCLMKRLYDLFELQVSRVSKKRQALETLIYEEMLFTKFPRDGQKTWMSKAIL